MKNISECCILVVDDNFVNREVASEVLEQEGATVSVAEDGSEAMRLVTEQSYDLILLDLFMPGVDGFQVGKQLRADDETRSIPIIVLSAADQDNLDRAHKEFSPEAIVTKPIDLTELANCAKRILATQ